MSLENSVVWCLNFEKVTYISNGGYRISWITVPFDTNFMGADTRKCNAMYNYTKGNSEIKNYQRNMKIGDMEFLKWKLAWCHLVRICGLSDGGLWSRTLWAFYLLAYSGVMWRVAKQQSVSLLNKSQVQISLSLFHALPWRHCSLSISWIALT